MNLITEQLIEMDQTFERVEECLKKGAQKLYEAGCTQNLDQLLEAFKERERHSTTAIGDGIAIPHANADIVDKPMLCVFRLPESMPWTEGEDVDFIMFIAVNGNAKGELYLRVLSRISKYFMDETFRERLKIVDSKEGMLDLLEYAIDDRWGDKCE